MDVNTLSLLRRQSLLSVAYATVAAFAIKFTHPDGTIALLWGASALLIAALVRTAPHHWWAPILACFLPGTIYSLAMSLELFFLLMFINTGEAVIAAWILRRNGAAGESISAHEWLRHLLFAAVAGPAAMAPLVSAALYVTGHEQFVNVAHYVAGHALGNLIFTPLALMWSGARARRETGTVLRQNPHVALLIFAASLGASLLTFSQNLVPLLFISSLVAVASTVRLGREGAAMSIATIALVGAWLTGSGLGPVYLIPIGLPGQLLMFQFFLAVTVLTVLPVAAELESRKALLQRVRVSETEFRLLAEYSTDAIVRITTSGHISYVSPSIYDLTGYWPHELVGQRSRILVDPRDVPRVLAERGTALATGGGSHTYSYRIRRKDGEVRWLETHARPIFLDDGERELLAILRDVTAFREREAELSEAALTDPLTGLPNRRAIEAAVARLPPGDHCMALLDLDHFKQVNDTYGHGTGDIVLQKFAELARRLVRTHDTVARLGGEEFVILFEDSRVDQAYQVCDRLRQVLAQTPLVTSFGALRLTVSGGVVAIGGEGLDASLQAADDALYRAKRSGRDKLLLAA